MWRTAARENRERAYCEPLNIRNQALLVHQLQLANLAAHSESDSMARLLSQCQQLATAKAELEADLVDHAMQNAQIEETAPLVLASVGQYGRGCVEDLPRSLP